MDPQFAASLWKKYFHPLKKLGVRIGSPAVTSSEAGRAWLRQFLAACDGHEIDFLSLIGHFYDYIWSMNGEFGLPIWITEYASTSTSMEQVAHFMKETTKYLDDLSFVERYW
ncbi:hypothetical protein Clacol_004792 [Clathrus columnatus]|uniref:Asl1-like glycosyl hydrolase catalytic domain-containing protein n=1 Tax=Clathrus columnatus TaxID=1419009 RepID=A0AAV5ACB9_9AGAM|nr:hypothetical protein Clacol_004792 [Clathrus columnatus]